MKKLLPLMFLLMGCTDNDGAQKALEAQGFSDIQFTGFQAFSCGEGDNFSSGFVAKNPKGVKVKGVACCGLLKACTLRF